MFAPMLKKDQNIVAIKAARRVVELLGQFVSRLATKIGKWNEEPSLMISRSDWK